MSNWQSVSPRAVAVWLGIWLSATPAYAQLSANATIYATGLNNPRGLAFDPVDNVLYVVEAGTGGSNDTVGECAQVPAPLGPFMAGNSARIVGITPCGNQFTLVGDLPSSQTQHGDILGPTDIEIVDDELYVLIAAGCSKGHADFPNAVAKVTGAGLQIVADLSQYNRDNPQNFPPDDDHDPEGNPYSFRATDDGDLLVVEANHGTVDRVSPDGTITRVVDLAALTQVYDTPVAIDISRKGEIFIGAYGVFPFTAGLSTIYRIDRRGRFSVATSGLTTVIDIVFDEKGKDLYILETSTGNDGTFPFVFRNTGRVLKRKKNGKLSVVATGLDLPSAMTLGPDGALYVSNRGHGAAPGQGTIVRIEVD